MKPGEKPSKNTRGKLAEPPRYDLKLYVAGNESNSLKAIEIIRETCQKYLGRNYHLEIIDVFENYQAALGDRILVAPTLVWNKKGTPAFLIGSFDRPKLLVFLGLSETTGGEK
ncbi:MAG: circadian clock KaiB family protein [Candidatus Saccharicenans sp.]|nr:circadian clock KaiB family protein [Candidatus Saccharicenans sp.]